ncbi:transcriptional regulator, MarR family with acetyltransferase activity [Rhodobacter sp. 24-YEA-8]|nr:transcriptional regulator, MarR family with acetyltransferase activity [Rhodobacter sp. 24-YEA-8]
MTPPEDLVQNLRLASRQLVRELGFMGGSFAGTDLPPSAVHALIEIDAGRLTARELAPLLKLEKSSVSRMLRKLVASGDVAQESGHTDARMKLLTLTKAGRRRVSDIHAFARDQILAALEQLEPGQDRLVLDGLSIYSAALSGRRKGQHGPAVEVMLGYCTGLIARITQMHAHYYAQASGFGRRFEAVVAGGLAEFCNRIDNPRNAIWSARQGEQILGSIAIDGEDMGEDIAHLRWFIVDNALRGTGTGRKLLSAALAFADAQGFGQTQLWTFSSLTSARHLYEASGFVLAEERRGSQWGREVMEQRFVRPRQA